MRFQYSLRSLLLVTFALAVALGGVTARLRQLASQHEAVEAISKHYGQFWCARYDGLWTRFFFGEFGWTDPVVLLLYVEIPVDHVWQKPDGSVTKWSTTIPSTAPSSEIVALVKRLPRLDELVVSDRAPPEIIDAIHQTFPKCRIKTKVSPRDNFFRYR